uniref:Uncharacterized protein n=1 Tax=Rhizophora mucronata TaxID=61149 RepID=A0A2P2J7Y4_RHIMU
MSRIIVKHSTLGNYFARSIACLC